MSAKRTHTPLRTSTTHETIKGRTISPAGSLAMQNSTGNCDPRLRQRTARQGLRPCALDHDDSRARRLLDAVANTITRPIWRFSGPPNEREKERSTPANESFALRCDLTSACPIVASPQPPGADTNSTHRNAQISRAQSPWGRMATVSRNLVTVLANLVTVFKNFATSSRTVLSASDQSHPPNAPSKASFNP